MAWALALVALALLGVAAVSRRLSGTPITPAILFVAFGLLVGPEVLDGIDLSSSTAARLADRYARWYERHPREKGPAMESVPAEVRRPRGPAGHPT